MACLLVFIQPDHPSVAFDPGDVLAVLPAGQHPGLAMTSGADRFGFLYITDKECEDVCSDLTDPVPLDDGQDDYTILKARRWGIDSTALPKGLEMSCWYSYESPEAFLVSHADLLSRYLLDKEASSGEGGK